MVLLRFETGYIVHLASNWFGFGFNYDIQLKTAPTGSFYNQYSIATMYHHIFYHRNNLAIINLDWCWFDLDITNGPNEHNTTKPGISFYYTGKRRWFGGSVVEWFGALVLKSGGPWFKSSTLPLSGFVLGSPEINSSTALWK